MRAFAAITRVTCKSVIRSHIFQFLLLLLLFTVIMLPVTLIGDGTALAKIQISLQYCLGAVSFILSISTIWLSCFAMSSDIENYQIHMLVTKPVSRVTLWAGKAVGILLIHSFLLVFSAVLVYILVLCQFQDEMFLKYIEWPLGIIAALAALTVIGSLGIWGSRFFLKTLKINFFKGDDREKNSVMLLKIGLSAFAVLIIVLSTFAALKWQFNKSTFSLLEKVKIKNEVLVGRRVYMPQWPKLSKRIKEEYQKTIQALPAEKRNITAAKQEELRREIHRQLLVRRGEVKAGGSIFWHYKGLKKKQAMHSLLFLRYRTYIGKVSSGNQRETMGLWGARRIIPVQAAAQNKKNSREEKEYKEFFDSLTDYPTNIMGGIFNEILMPPDIISRSGEAVIGFRNFDPQRKTLFFQVQDGPKLLVKITGFMANYSRAIFVIFLKLLFLTLLSCAVGGVVSSSVAIFSVVSYLMFGFFATYLIAVDNRLVEAGGPVIPAPLIDQIGSFLSKALVVFITPMENFEVSSLLAGGELIEFSMIGHLLFFNVLLRGIPFVLVGVWLYRRRELGVVIKK